MIRRFRSWAKAHRVGGMVWVLSVLWVGIGAAASGYVFLSPRRRSWTLRALSAGCLTGLAGT